MTYKYRNSVILTMLLVAAVAAAGPVERINSIKRDSLFIYGEATKASTAEAYDAALNILQSNIQQWCDMNAGNKNTMTVRNLTFLADTINAMRGEYHRVLAYVAIAKVEDAIRSDAEQEAAARKGSRPSVPDSGIPLISDPETKAMLQALMAKPLFRDFAAQVTLYRQEGRVSMASRDISRQPAGSYLAIFSKDRKDETLMYLMAPGQGIRDDLVSGKPLDSELFLHQRNSYRFLWFVPSNPNKKEQ